MRTQLEILQQMTRLCVTDQFNAERGVLAEYVPDHELRAAGLDIFTHENSETLPLVAADIIGRISDKLKTYIALHGARQHMDALYVAYEIAGLCWLASAPYPLDPQTEPRLLITSVWDWLESVTHEA